MTTFVAVDFPAQHPGVARIERSLAVFSEVGVGHLLLSLLARVGAPVVRVAGLYARWRAAGRAARADALYWRVALGDARVMADISRAMSAEAQNVNLYWKARD